MHVPFLNLQAEFKLFGKQVKQSLNKLFSKQQWILSEEVAQFEREAAAYLAVHHALGVSSGTDALVLALRAMAIQRFGKEFFSPEDEILVPSFTFVASAESIVRAGGSPVFVDVDYDDCTVSPETLEQAITPQTRGIVVVHLFGLSCNIRKIMEVARRYNLFVIEDCAQSFGAKVTPTRSTGTFGQCGCFSFFPTKNLGAFGDAGMITTNDPKRYALLKALRNHGGEDKYNIDYIGYNARLDTVQAEVLRIKLKFIDRFLAQRRTIGRCYQKVLSSLPEHLAVPSSNPLHTFNQYTVKVLRNKRDALKQYLGEQGIATQVYYPVPLHLMKVFKPYKKSGGLPVTERLSRECLSLPVHPLLKKKEQEYVVGHIKKFFTK